VKPLAEVRDEIRARLETQRAAEAALEEAEAIAERVRNGQRIADAAGDYEVVDSGRLERSSAQAPRAVVDQAFSLPRPEGSGATPSVATTADGAGDAFVVSVSEVIDGDPEAMDEAVLAGEARVLRRALATTDVDEVVASMMARARIEREPVVSDEPF
jgi:hypothetical protein